MPRHLSWHSAGSAQPRTHLARGGRPSALHLQAAPNHGRHVAVVRHHCIDDGWVLQGARPSRVHLSSAVVAWNACRPREQQARETRRLRTAAALLQSAVQPPCASPQPSQPEPPLLACRAWAAMLQVSQRRRWVGAGPNSSLGAPGAARHALWTRRRQRACMGAGHERAGEGTRVVVSGGGRTPGGLPPCGRPVGEEQLDPGAVQACKPHSKCSGHERHAYWGLNRTCALVSARLQSAIWGEVRHTHGPAANRTPACAAAHTAAFTRASGGERREPISCLVEFLVPLISQPGSSVEGICPAMERSRWSGLPAALLLNAWRACRACGEAWRSHGPPLTAHTT